VWKELYDLREQLNPKPDTSHEDINGFYESFLEKLFNLLEIMKVPHKAKCKSAL
jgi:hypothetical protein